MDKNAISYWYPRISQVEPNTPRTFWKIFDYDFLEVLDGAPVKLLKPLVSWVQEKAQEVGYPCFIKTGVFSGKHFWKDTCYLESQHRILYQIHALIEHSCLACTLGLPTNEWVIRQLLSVKPAFYAFNSMPITKERRYFVRDGRVECCHPYWPESAIRNPSIPNWKNELKKINIMDDEEINFLTKKTEKIGSIMDGYWSVDWLWVEKYNKWFLIDMADGDRSFHWSSCNDR